MSDLTRSQNTETFTVRATLCVNILTRCWKMFSYGLLHVHPNKEEWPPRGAGNSASTQSWWGVREMRACRSFLEVAWALRMRSDVKGQERFLVWLLGLWWGRPLSGPQATGHRATSRLHHLAATFPWCSPPSSFCHKRYLCTTHLHSSNDPLCYSIS